MTPVGGEQQEDWMRRQLASEGYEQRYGVNDQEIRRNLGITGRCADFVGYHPQRGFWLIAESKGSDLDVAYKQLEETLRALLAKEPGAVGSVDLRIYMRSQQYQKLLDTGLSGYYLRDHFLGCIEGNEVFQFLTLQDMRIQVRREGPQ
jgi:hypothetical protein